MEDKKWKRAHETLKQTMKTEIALLRELLSNLFEEELSLSKHNPYHLSSIRENRCELIKQLGIKRKERLNATRKLEKTTFIKQKGKKLPLDELFRLDDENSSEILTLHTQMKELMKKMHLQKHRNHHLRQELTNAPLLKPVLQKKKSAVATFPSKGLQ